MASSGPMGPHLLLGSAPAKIISFQSDTGLSLCLSLAQLGEVGVASKLSQQKFSQNGFSYQNTQRLNVSVETVSGDLFFDRG